MNETVQSTSSAFDAFSQAAINVTKDKDIQREIDTELYAKHKIARGTFNELLVNNEKFNELPVEEQGSVITSLFNFTKEDYLNPEHFYNQKQIGRIRKYKREASETLSLPFTFNDYFVIQTSESDYLTALKYKTIAAIWNNQILEYNLDLQRKPKEKLNAKTGQIVKTPKVIMKSVKEITELMERGKYRSNTITFCILRDGTEDISYEDGELTVNEGKIFIINGFHRLSALLNFLESNPDTEEAMDTSVKYLTADEAAEYLGQINKMSKFDKSFTNFLMSSKLEEKIAKEVVNKSALRDRVAKEATVAKKSLYITSYNVLFKGIKDSFNPQDGKDRIDIAEVLVNFFDYLIASYPEDFTKNLGKFIEAKESSLRNYHNTFILYIQIAKALYDKYGKKIPSDEIIRLVELFDYSKDGEYAKVLFAEGTGKVNSNQVKKNIREYAEAKVKEALN